jgi:hypothetical protein
MIDSGSAQQKPADTTIPVLITCSFQCSSLRDEAFERPPQVQGGSWLDLLALFREADAQQLSRSNRDDRLEAIITAQIAVNSILTQSVWRNRPIK